MIVVKLQTSPRFIFISNPQAAVNCVAFNEDSSVVVSGSVDTTVKVWDTRSRAQDPIQTLEEPRDSVTSLDISDHEVNHQY